MTSRSFRGAKRTSASLPAEINAASRSLHTHLNALITSRLPLALPPHTTSPDAYLTGILHFAHVFIAFERAWDEVCRRQPASSSSPSGSALLDDRWIDVPLDDVEQDSGAIGGNRGISDDGNGSNKDRSIHGSESHRDQHQQPKPQADRTGSISSSLTAAGVEEKEDDGDDDDERRAPSERDLLAFLRAVRPAGLARSERLRRDITLLSGIKGGNDENLNGFLRQHESPEAAAFVAHVWNVAGQKPWALLAYSFVMYMAIFSGGRWIRSQLAAAGREFWTRKEQVTILGQDGKRKMIDDADLQEKPRTFSLAEQERLESMGLSFWFFDSACDGVDIKAEFRRRLEGAEGLLTAEQRADVVDEAVDIFHRCEALVRELDEQVGRQGKTVEGVSSDPGDGNGQNAGQPQPQPQPQPQQPWRRAAALRNNLWNDMPGYAGIALVLGCVSWYAMYHAGMWSA